jgi:hypothetical protein
VVLQFKASHENPSRKKNITKGVGGAGGVAQGAGPKFKPQYCNNNNNNNKKVF